jgi:DNA-directed RNA polymerase subunit RPC12/RpoP
MRFVFTKTPTECPECGSDVFRRSRRKTLIGYVLSFVYVWPYRCLECGNRFWALRGRKMSDFKIGQHVTVKLSGGRLVDAEIRAIIETTDGKRLQVSFGTETARIHLWQVVEKLR